LKKLTLAEKRRTKIGTAVVDTEKCIKCGLCARECPREIIIKERKQYPIIPENKCIGCGMCATVCPGKAIHIEPAEVQRLVD
jgi:ferredoxin